MADRGAPVRARLQNKAIESGRCYQLCLQLFCQEEFLRRLEKYKYAESFVLKGGLFIYSIKGFDSRVTVDVDFFAAKDTQYSGVIKNGVGRNNCVRHWQ